MGFQKSLKQDVIASSVVFLVAIPLCLGIALASNAPLFSGILAGIIGGVVIGTLSQSHVSVSGPAAGLVAVVLAGIHELGSFSAFLAALSLAGLMQVLIGKLKAGFVADYVPSNVIQGLLCAIGILIILKQIPFAVGYFAKPQAVFNELKEAQEGFDFQAILSVLDTISLGAMVICFTSLVLLFMWDKIKVPALKYIPGPVIVVALGIVANVVFAHFVPLLHLSSREYLVTIPAVQSWAEIKNLFTFPDLHAFSSIKVYLYAGLIAVVASIETLLNLEAAEKIDAQKRYCGRNHELVAQGIGNTLSGLLGGLPITSVVVRSSVNIQSGSRTKLSAILHGVWLLLSVLLIPSLINKIPLASLAAILIFVGFKLAHYKVFKTMFNRGFENFVPFIVTTVVIVATDLLSGVLAGLAVNAFLVMKYNSRPDFKQQLEVYPNGEILRIMLPEQATFLNKAALISALRDLPSGSHVLLDATQTHYIDYDIKEVIEEFSANLSREKNISICTKGFKAHYVHGLRDDFLPVTTAHTQKRLDPTKVLAILQEGNKRYLSNQQLNREIPLQVSQTAPEAHPIAVVLSCVDSRVPVEMVFDVGIGDLFVTRVLGNIVNEDVLASVEYACAVAGAKLIVVMGHTSCGAIKAAVGEHTHSHFSYASEKFKPIIEVVKQRSEKLENASDAFFDEVARTNMHRSRQLLQEQSPTLAALLKAGQVGIVGAMYDVKTGQVTFDALEQVDANDYLVARKVTPKEASSWPTDGRGTQAESLA